MEEFFINAIKEYGYFILFIWSILEGELGLIMAGMLCHTGDMFLPVAIFVAGLGGFVGDQIYYYIGRYNKKFIYSRLEKQRRKFAMAHLLLHKYGWPIIFVQRYLYGLRTILPMSIGVSGYSPRKFAIINFFSALVWAAITINLAYFFGEELISLLKIAKEHAYVALPFAIIIGGGIYYYLHKATQKVGNRATKNIAQNKIIDEIKE